MLFPHFSLCNDLFNHRDISYVSFFNCSLIYYLINVYSDSSQSALKYLKNTEVNLNNVLIINGDFNIRDNFWDSNFLYYSSYKCYRTLWTLTIFPFFYLISLILY